jgi:hypothetical protein
MTMPLFSAIFTPSKNINYDSQGNKKHRTPVNLWKRFFLQYEKIFFFFFSLDFVGLELSKKSSSFTRQSVFKNDFFFHPLALSLFHQKRQSELS